MPTKLGQNFLRDEAVLQKIIDASELNSEDFVIEIGPGEGVLTEQLAKCAKKVLAIELDNNLIPILEKKFVDQKNIEFVHGDILNINLSELIKNNVETPRRGVSAMGTYKLIANIPYYITSPIIRLFLEQEYQPQEMILMVQKEVAERICAKTGKMSILAVSVQYYADPKLLFYVDKKSFFPVPEVDSAVIKITTHKSQNTNKLQTTKEQTKHFFKVVKAGFSAKRKTLLNNLTNGLQLDKKIVEKKLETLGLKPTVRAQELSVNDWKKLSSALL